MSNKKYVCILQIIKKLYDCDIWDRYFLDNDS